MRFFEFKLPEPGTDFAKQLENYFLKIIQKAQSLPENDPKRKDLNLYLSSIKSELGIKEDAVEDVGFDLIKTILLKSGVQEASLALLNMANIIKDSAIQTELQKLIKLGGEKEKERSQEVSKTVLEKSQKVARKVGKDDSWGIDLSERLARFQDIDLINSLLDNSLNNTCFKDPMIFKTDGVVKGKLQNFVIPELAGLFSNQGFTYLAKMPFDVRGMGPGEALLAILIPNAKKASKGDLEINDETWEVKGAGYKADGADNQSWIDSAGINVKGTTLGEIFRNKVRELLGNKVPETITVSGKDLDFESVLNAADFRSKALSSLAAILTLLEFSKKQEVINSVYSKLFPGCKEKIPEEYESFINDSIDLISKLDLSALARLQTKFSLKEYGLGAYNSPNFIFYNPTYQDVVFSKGVSAVDDFYNDPQFSVSPITMRGDKPSPGMFLKSPEVVRRSRSK
jgi:hypothetical protein